MAKPCTARACRNIIRPKRQPDGASLHRSPMPLADAEMDATRAGWLLSVSHLGIDGGGR